MKLSIFIFVLMVISYGCQCAPSRDWEKNLKQLHEQLEVERQQREETLRQNMENLHKKLDEDREKRNQQLEAARQQREENLKQLHERLAVERKQREEDFKQLGTASDQINNGYTQISIGNYSSMTTSETVNGNRVETTIEERIVGNVKYRTIIKHTPALNKTEIEYYECSLAMNSTCILQNHITKKHNEHNV